MEVEALLDDLSFLTVIGQLVIYGLIVLCLEMKKSHQIKGQSVYPRETVQK